MKKSSMTGNRGTRADGELTRARILETAGQLFAAHGFAGTPSKTIAAQAEVDLASINYHFGSRHGLYQATLAEAHRRVMDIASLRALADSPLSAEDKLHTLIRHLVDMSRSERSGWHLTVLATEFLAPSLHLETLFSQEVLPKALVLKQIIAGITGMPEDDPALTRSVVSILAPCLVLLLGGRGIPGPLQELSRQPADAIVAHLYQFAMGGLRACSPTPAQRELEDKPNA